MKKLNPGFRWFCLLFMLHAGTVHAGGENGTEVYAFTAAGTFETSYQALYKALEDARFYVIFEANIGKNLARNAERWGENYNRNQFEQMKSMVVCNPWYANQALNLDPAFMAMCPLTIGVLHKAGTTRIYFRKLMQSDNALANDLIWEVENTIISAIETIASPVN